MAWWSPGCCASAAWRSASRSCSSRPYAGDAAWAEGRAREAGVALDGSLDAALDGADLVVDALLGTGFAGVPRDAVAAAIDAIGASGLPVLALDVPSGIDASTGEAGERAVRADVTVTFHAAKLGLRIEPGASCAGEVVVVAIGIPEGAEAPAPGVLAGPAAIAALPPRPRGGSKYDAGRVTIVAGSRGMTGACTLAGRAALRGGAGHRHRVRRELARADPRGDVDRGHDARRARTATAPCSPAPSAPSARSPSAAGPWCSARAWVATPGTQALVRALLDLANPLVLDADGLYALGEELEALAGRSAPTVITPHGGEAGRLLGRDRTALEARRLDAARELARRSGAIALLKGPDTIIATPDGRLAVRDGDEPGLATAGTGDVLSGVIGALLARGAEPFLAAAAGAAAHLAAARAAVAAVPGRAIIAGDVVEHLRLGSVQP